MEETLPSSCLQPNKWENATGCVAEGLSTQTPREADSGNCPPSASSLLVQHKGNLNRTLHCTLYAGCTRWIVWFRNRFLNSIVASPKLHIQLTFLSHETEGKYMDLCLTLLLKMRDLSYSLSTSLSLKFRNIFSVQFLFPCREHLLIHSFGQVKSSVKHLAILPSVTYQERKVQTDSTVYFVFTYVHLYNNFHIWK